MSSTWRRHFVHLVWGTFERLATLDAAREDLVARMIALRARRRGCELLAFGASDDHVHVLLSLHPSQDVAALVRWFKSATTIEIERIDARHPPFRWQAGYGVLSVDPHETAGLREYIDNQRDHHANGTTIPSWEPQLESLDPTRRH